MKSQFNTYILPSCYASYFVNSDPSGLNDEDISKIDNFVKENQTPGHMFFCCGVSEESFFKWSNDLENLGADCLEYTFNISKIK